MRSTSLAASFVAVLAVVRGGPPLGGPEVRLKPDATTWQAPARLAYTAVHDPEFISASAATFMGGDDRVIGLMSGKTAKAYPAGILSQHGLVEDQSPKGPIAITW